jgi:hypothetical protein
MPSQVDESAAGAGQGLRLEDIELIKQLKYRFWRSLDTMDVEEMRRCFVAKPVIHQQGGSYLVHFEDLDEYLDFLPKALHAEVVSSHLGLHPEITVHNEREASGIWMLLDSSMDLLRKVVTRGQAIARDKYLKEKGLWKIKEATYTRVYEIVEPLVVAPNLTAHYLRDHGTKLESLDVFNAIRS